MSYTVNLTNRNTFENHLRAAYEDLFVNDPEYNYVSERTTPQELASKIVVLLADGNANKDGKGIKRACKAVGIKHTYKAIKEYLNK